MYIAGFRFVSQSFFAFYPHSALPDSSVIYSGCQAPIRSYSLAGFKSLKDNSTIGISFDAFTNKIGFRVENEQKGYYINFPNEKSSYFAHVWHASAGDPDYLSINFGAQPFVYSIPPGYTTLDKEMAICNPNQFSQPFDFDFIKISIILYILT